MLRACIKELFDKFPKANIYHKIVEIELPINLRHFFFEDTSLNNASVKR
jgi:hypothetical protein